MLLCSLGTMRLLLDHQSAPKPRNVLARQPASATVDQEANCSLRADVFRFPPDTGHRSIGSSPASRHRGGYVVVRLRATSGHGIPLNGLTTIWSPPNSRAFTRAVGPQAAANQVVLI